MAENIAPVFPGQESFIDWEEISASTSNPNIFDHTLTEIYAGTYEVTVGDDYGCEITKEVTLGFDKGIFIPNVFTPNGDGVNDYFFVRNLPDAGSGTKLTISNRWGNLVFESSDYNYDNLWDGEDNNDGIYFYTLYIPGEKTFNGWVEIWRGDQR